MPDSCKRKDRWGLTAGAQNWPFLMLITRPVLAAAMSRSVCKSTQTMRGRPLRALQDSHRVKEKR